MGTIKESVVSTPGTDHAPTSPTSEKRMQLPPQNSPTRTFDAPPIHSAPTLKDIRRNPSDLEARRVRSRTLSMSQNPNEAKLGRALSRIISP